MAMLVGQAQAEPTTGLAGRIWEALKTSVSPKLNGTTTTDLTNQAGARKFCEAIATAVIAEIQANATVIVKTTDASLQRDNTGGNPSTLGPSANRTLPGGAIQ